MEKIYAAPVSATHYAVFIGDKQITLLLSEQDARKLADRYNAFEGGANSVAALKDALRESAADFVFLRQEVEKEKAELVAALDELNAIVRLNFGISHPEASRLLKKYGK